MCSMQRLSRNVVGLAAAADRVRLVPEEFAVSGRGFGILVDREQDGADVVVAPALMRADAAGLRQRLDERRMVVSVAIPFQRLVHHALSATPASGDASGAWRRRVRPA